MFHTCVTGSRNLVVAFFIHRKAVHNFSHRTNPKKPTSVMIQERELVSRLSLKSARLRPEL